MVLWLYSLVYLKSITMREAFVLKTGQLQAVCSQIPLAFPLFVVMWLQHPSGALEVPWKPVAGHSRLRCFGVGT